MKDSKQQAQSPRALSEIEATNYISMSRSFLAQSHMDGHRKGRTQAPPFIKTGRSVCYVREDLDCWLDTSTSLSIWDRRVSRPGFTSHLLKH